MKGAKKFLVDGQGLASEPYHYRACGLDDVYLLNGFSIEETDYGRGVAIHNVEGLHRAIAWHLINERKPLTPRELRFLRKQAGLTQEKLASKLSLDVQTIARHEKGQTSIPAAVDAIVRQLCAIALLPPKQRAAALTAVLEELGEHRASEGGGKFFRQTSRGWDATVQ